MRHHRLIPVAALCLVAHSASAQETVFDFSAPGSDQEGDYATEGDVVLDGGTAVLGLVADPEWWDPGLAYRKTLTLTAAASMTQPRLTIPLDAAGADLFDLALADGSDLVLVDALGWLVDPVWVAYFDRIRREGDLRVVAESLASGDSGWQVYFGGASLPDDRLGVFTHATAQELVFAGDGLTAASSDLVVVSFVDSNTVTAPGLSTTLDAGEWVAVPAGTLSAAHPVTATGPIFAVFEAGGDAAPTRRLASTLFVHPCPRHAERFTFVSPEADATVTITGSAGVLDTVAVAAGTVEYRDIDVPNMESVTFASDVPVIVTRSSTDGVDWYDYMAIPPPATDVTGPLGGTGVVAALEDGTTGEIHYSDGTTETFSLDALEVHTMLVAGSHGDGPAARIVADRPVAALTYADGDGGDLVTWLPTRWLGTEFRIPFDAQYVFVSAPEPSTSCRLEHGGGTEVLVSDSLAPPWAKRLFWGDVAAGAHIVAPAHLTCTKPVHAYAERTLDDDEVNLWPLRFFRDREPDVTFSWGPTQTRFGDGSGSVTTPTFVPSSGVVAWRGFEERGLTGEPAGTAIRWLASTDGGGTWLAWDGEGWSPASGAGDAMTGLEVSESIALLPAGDGGIALEAFLETADGVETPVLDEVAVLYEPPGPVDRFVFGYVPPTVISGSPFELTITALDATGHVASSFTDSAILTTEPAVVTVSPWETPEFTAGELATSVTLSGVGTVTLVALSGEVRGEAGPIQVVAGSGPAARLEIVGGEEQFGPAGLALPELLRVRVLDEEGLPVPDESVGFTVTAGGGSVTPTTAITGGDGVGSVLWTLGPDPGTNRVQADAGDIEGSPAGFVARGDPEDWTPGDGDGDSGGCGCNMVW